MSELEPKPEQELKKEPVLELEPEPEQDQKYAQGWLAQQAVLLMLAQVQVLAQEREREQVSALETMVAPLRTAPACLGHRPPEAQRPIDDQIPRRHLDQRPRNRT